MTNPSKIRMIFVFVFVVLQIFLSRFSLRVNFIPDLLFLIIVYNALRSSFFKTYFVACVLGWLTDYFCGGIVGVFGFSRVISAALVHEIIRYIDLKKKGFTFFLVFVSLAFSNAIAQVFFSLIHAAPVSISLLLWQPLATAFLAFLLVHWRKIGQIWDVY